MGIELERAFKRDLGFRSLLREQERFADPFEEIAIIGELGLHFGERAITLHDEGRRFALHAGVNVSNAEIARSQIGRRLAPGGDAAISRRIGKRFWAALNSVIGEGGGAAIFGVAARHVASKAVAIFRGMRGSGGKFRRVAVEAYGAVIRDGLQRLIVRFFVPIVVRVVACAAPQAAMAIARAGAQRELFHMSDKLDRAGGIRVIIGREYIFGALAGHEVAEGFSGIGDARDSEQVALLADAVASGGGGGSR